MHTYIRVNPKTDNGDEIKPYYWVGMNLQGAEKLEFKFLKRFETEQEAWDLVNYLNGGFSYKLAGLDKIIKK